ncbi:Putative Mannose-specific lectin [Kitasatospora sp. MMS16-BH015]|uniref:hypothetical protein n=1 Tax=Kitasatospora sp. MMS16-BH015 TaxID=2018025 RepID=UPI000CA0D0F9|nr:hypothetical protein [Kitasatospora sp. MMS16-BH015]AUG81228.1 Putative Mannose-specific lectin [Kitasatospora sp. MMS16-BH015]
MNRMVKRLSVTAACVASALATVLGVSPSASAATQSIPLLLSTPDEKCGWSTSSSTVRLSFQCDGNLVLYRISDNHAMWATGTYQGNGWTPDLLSFSHEGYIKLFSHPWYGHQLECIWGDSSAAEGRVAVQDDGNLVIYTPSGTPIWDSGTYNNLQGTVHECR